MARRAVRSEQARKNRAWHYNLRRYGLDEYDYEAMLKRQGGACAICGTADPGAGREHFSVDHDHRTGRVRGLLCNSCNKGLGSLGDTADAVARALAYLRRAEEN